MKNLIIGLLAGLSASALLFTVLTSEKTTQYEPRDTKAVVEKGYKGAAKWAHSRRANQVTKVVDLKDVEMAKAEIANIKKSRANLNITWKNVGPTNIGGRTRAILIDKNNPDVMYAGGVSGGLWKSTTAGSSWEQIRYSGDAETSDIPNLAIASICQAANGDIYFGTGEGHYQGYGTGSRGIRGEGIWKSTDGETFTRLNSTWSSNESKQTFAYVNKLTADPNNANRIFAATARGVRLTEDGGQTWTNPVIDIVNNITLTFMAGDIEISSDGNIVIVSMDGKAYVSKQGGATGTFVKVSGSESNLIATASRLEFSIAPSDGNYIYCQAASVDDASLLNVYRSTDGGDNWTVIGPGGSDQFNPLGTQGTYDNIIAVFPDNKNEILLGGQYGIWHWSDTEGWEVRSYWNLPMNSLLYVHADQHAIVFNPENPDIVFVGSDGGISRSLNRGVTWQTRNKNYAVTQFYGLGFGPQNELIGGAQDNGSLYMDPFQPISGGTPYHYVEVSGGDGGYCEISQINPNILFSTSQYGRLFRSEERGADGSVISPYSDRLKIAVKPGTNGDNPFVTPIALWEDFNTETDIDVPIIVPEGATHAGDTIYVTSLTSSAHKYMYILENDHNVGDTITGKIKETKEARLAVGFNGSVWVDRFPLNLANSSWVPVSNTVGKVGTLTWSDDGKHLFVANEIGELFRISNFENATEDSLMDVEEETACVLTTTKIADFGMRFITSIAVDPNNANNVFVTLGNYGNSTYVYYSTEAATTTATNTFSSKQGNLPHMPCYAGLIVWNDSNKVLIGTEFGIWATDNISSSNPSWTNENDGADYIPVFMLRQQTMKNGLIEGLNEDNGVRNHGTIWAATHGRGIFKTTDFEGPVGIEETETTFSNESLNIYPNPATETTNINFDLKSRQDVSIMVYDMRGRMVYTENLDNMSMGEHTHQLSVSTFNKGIYVVKLIAGKSEQISKIVVE